MLDAILLDLDNTLILYDEIEYYQKYFEKIHRSFADVFELEAFKDRLIKGTLALGGSQGEQTNRDHFMEVFAHDHAGQGDSLWQRFMTFYGNGYTEMGVTITVPEGVQAALTRFRQAGLKLVIASNPIFPVAAQKVRMGWGGLNPEGFDLFTSIENMHYVKPRREYFLQTCSLIGTAPENCLMVGNDLVNDMAAAGAGLKTYRTTDAGVVDYASLTLTDEQRREDLQAPPKPDFEGPFAGVVAVVEKLLDRQI